MYFHHFTLPTVVVIVMALSGYLLSRQLSGTHDASRYFGYILLFLSLTYCASLYALMQIDSHGAYHRCFTVTFSLLAAACFSRFFAVYPRALNTRFMDWLWRIQLGIVLIASVGFTFLAWHATPLFRVRGHYWDLNLPGAGQVVAVLLITCVAFAGIFAGVQLGRCTTRERRDLLGIFSGLTLLLLVPAIALALYRAAVIEPLVFVACLVFAFIPGFILAVHFYMNAAPVRISVFMKISILSSAGLLTVVSFSSIFQAASIESAYENSRRLQLAQHLAGGVAPAGLLYVDTVDETQSGMLPIREASRTVVLQLDRDGRRLSGGFDYLDYREFVHELVAPHFLGMGLLVILLALIYRFFASRSIFVRLAGLVAGMRQVDGGDLSVQLATPVRDELGYLATALNSLVGSARIAREERGQQFATDAANHQVDAPNWRSARVTEIDVRGSTYLYASQSMAAVVDRVEKIASLEQPVLVTGETGTGKEFVAELLHERGSRADGPFVAVNCAAIPETLWESEVFGHTRGAFTDAKQDRPGLVTQARGGTLFFDEIGELPRNMQPKILRLLQERVYQPVGGRDSLPVECRLVFATHRNLAEMVARREFREDLYYRVNVLEIAVPALRTRRVDVPIIAQALARRYSAEMGRPPVRIEPEALERLMQYEWRGNVRELENFMIRLLAGLEGDCVTFAALPVVFASSENSGGGFLRTGEGFEAAVTRYSRELIQQALVRANGNVSLAARNLEISRGKLQYQMRALEMSG